MMFAPEHMAKICQLAMASCNTAADIPIEDCPASPSVSNNWQAQELLGYNPSQGEMLVIPRQYPVSRRYLTVHYQEEHD